MEWAGVRAVGRTDQEPLPQEPSHDARRGPRQELLADSTRYLAPHARLTHGIHATFRARTYTSK